MHPDAFADEALRRAVLGALGVDLYQALGDLPGALPSWLPEPANVSDPEPAPAPVVAAPPVAAPIRLDPPAVRPARPAPQASSLPAAVVADRKAAGSRIRFPVAVLPLELPGHWRALVQLGDGDAPSLDSREHALWSDLAFALCWRRQARIEPLPLFRFPPTRPLAHLGSAAAWCEAITGFLQARASRIEVPHTLLFVDAPLREALAGREDLILLPSLQEILADGALKPLVWQRLRPLVLA